MGYLQAPSAPECPVPTRSPSAPALKGAKEPKEPDPSPVSSAGVGNGSKILGVVRRSRCGRLQWFASHLCLEKQSQCSSEKGGWANWWLSCMAFKMFQTVSRQSAKNHPDCPVIDGPMMFLNDLTLFFTGEPFEPARSTRNLVGTSATQPPPVRVARRLRRRQSNPQVDGPDPVDGLAPRWCEKANQMPVPNYWCLAGGHGKSLRKSESSSNEVLKVALACAKLLKSDFSWHALGPKP